MKSAHLRYRLRVLKTLRLAPILCGPGCVLPSSSFSFLGGEDQRWGWRAEEADQSFDVLRSRSQKELLPNEFHAS
jgi:hypothetical protein